MVLLGSRSPRTHLSSLEISRLRKLFGEIEQALGFEDAQAVWQSIPWGTDPAQRLLELAHYQFNGTLTQPEWEELNRLHSDPAVKASPGSEGKEWLRRARKEAPAFFDLLSSRYGKRIARQALSETLDREAHRPAKADLDAAMLNVKAWLKAHDVKDYSKQTALILSKALKIDLDSARRRLERAAAARKRRRPPA